MRTALITTLLTILLASCLKDEPIKNEYTGFEPKDIGDGWTISTPEAEGIDNTALDQAYRLLYSKQRFLMARSLLVVRNGNLIAEGYPHDISDRDIYANIQSCTKSFTSIMLGIAIQNGINISVKDKLYSIYPIFLMKTQENGKLQ